MNEGVASRDAAIDEMLAKAAIREVLWRYCRGVDRRDVELLTSCYHPDAYDDHMGNIYSGETVGQGLVDWMNEIMVKTTHNITTNNIEVFGDAAGSESYTTSMHIQKGNGQNHTLLSVARYVDRFERRNGEWRIVYRLVVAEFSGWASMQMHPYDSLARLDRQDPSYVVFEPEFKGRAI